MQKKYKNLKIIIILHLVSAAVVSMIFVNFLGQPFVLFPLHMLVIVLYLSALILSAAFISGPLPFYFIPVRKVFPFCAAAVFVFLIFLYIVDLAACLLWGRLVSGSLLVSIVEQYYSLLEEIPVLSIGGGILLVLLLVFLVLFYRISKQLPEESRELLTFLKDYLFRAKSRLVVFLLLVTLPLILAGIFFERNDLSREPVISFLKTKNIYVTLQLTKHRVRQMEISRKVRREYRYNKNFKKRNIILIIVDAMRDGHLSFAGYHRETTPFLSDLYERKKLVKISPAFSTTSESFGGILGTLASKTYKSISYENYSIQDLLKDGGYRVNMILSGDNTNFCDIKYFLGKSIDYYSDGISSRHFSINDDRNVLKALENVKDYDGTPAFFYFHLLSAHDLGVRENKYKRYRPTLSDISYNNLLREKYRKITLINHHDNGVLQADAYIKKIFSQLEQKGYLENSILWIIADHGDSVGEHNHYGHGHTLYQEEIAIPVLVYGKGTDVLKGVKFARQIDIAPTILDFIGLKKPSSWEGRSLLKKQSAGFSYHETRKQPGWKSVIRWKDNSIFKYLVKPVRGDSAALPEKEELYDLNRDPREEHNIITTVPSETAAFFRKKFHRFFIKKEGVPLSR